MSRWRTQIVSVVMLVALAGLPVVATTCAALCEPPAASDTTSARASLADTSATPMSMHHGTDAACHEPSTSADLRLTAGVLHDCGTHDGARREAEAARTAARVDGWTAVTVSFVASAPSAQPSSRLPGASPANSQPLIFSVATTPLVLRV